MTDASDKVREHYRPTNLTNRIKSALATVAPEGQMLAVAQLALLDQFHTRGILATAELATAAGIEPTTRVLDLGCGIGGPARYLAAKRTESGRSDRAGHSQQSGPEHPREPPRRAVRSPDARLKSPRCADAIAELVREFVDSVRAELREHRAGPEKTAGR